ncbi:transporter [Clostridium tetani E88]|uniref:Transporter n=2 Tax=Clostridium tetani TaxID=1513 RepID=Q890Z9_CLOTE|nr:transporter [Clostridium tetani E88]
MSVVGSLEAGLSSNNSTLYAKSVLDGFSAIIFSSTYGIGVAFSAISIFIYQGFIASLAFLIKDILTPEAINNMSIVGGLLISALGLNMLKITKIKVANLLPAILIPFIYEIFKNMIKLIGV